MATENYHRSLATLDQLARILRDVNEAAEVIRTIGAHEDHVNELKAAIAELGQQKEVALAEFQNIKRRVAEETAKAESALRDAQRESTELLESTRAACDAKVAEANRRADEIVSNANARAESIAKAARETVEATRGEIAQMKSELGDLEKKVEEKKTELADIQLKIAKARETVSKMFGDEE
jgi:chromosome segregation ATPase